MDQTPLPCLELEHLTHCLAAGVLASVSRELSPPRREDQPDKEDPGYQCSGLKFDCQDEYGCKAPHSCEIDFTCKQFSTPKPRPK